MATDKLPAIAAAVRVNGYAVWPGFLEPQTCAVGRHLAGALAAGEHANHYPKSTRVWDLYRHGDPFIDLLADPRLAAVVEELLGENFLLSDFSLNVVEPAQPVDDWHIDYPFNEMRSLVHGSLLGLQCVLALDRFSVENGATQLVAGSHSDPRRPGPAGMDGHTTFEAEPGTLLLMAAATWHRSGLNASGSARSAVLFSFVESWVRPMSDPPATGAWSRSEALRILLGIQRPQETINGVVI